LLVISLSGRWTLQEHELFLQGLHLHGKGWKKIAQMVQTRSVVQIRTHAQKYFLKLNKENPHPDLEFCKTDAILKPKSPIKKVDY
jgi:SHAQKYF class myb-like DNA-binding protein